MGKIDAWVPKIPRLKNAKVSRFSYKNAAYTNDDIEGVENYDYSRDMNVPSLTKTDTENSVLDSGARAQFSSLSKNALNHFFGRVSYNLNKVIDFLSDFLDDFISFTEIVSFSSSATLANYANGATKRLLNTAGSTITITLPAGETYLGNNTILLAPSIMLTITKRGTVWINSSGNAITADRWKTARNVTISDADGTNTGTAVSVDGSENETLKLPPTIKANITGNASTADRWKTARNVTISDADGTNTGTAVSVDGSENETLKLPATIKANITGNATNGFINIRRSANFTLPTYSDGTHISVANTHATNTITCTLPSGQTCCGQTSFVIQPKEILSLELIGTSWYVNKCLTTYTTIPTGGMVKTEKYSDKRLVIKGFSITITSWTRTFASTETRYGYTNGITYPIAFVGILPLISCTSETEGSNDPSWFAGFRYNNSLTDFNPVFGARAGATIKTPTKYDFIAEGYWE